MVRISHFLDSRLIDGGKIASLTHGPRSTPKKHHFSGTHFCLRLNKSQGLVRLEGLGNSFISSGLKPATFQLAAQCLKHLPQFRFVRHESHMT
jgi:hypothetical protein